MKRRPSGNLQVFSLSAIDIFASAMGAFIIIAIVLMPDYQKEVRYEGQLERLQMMVDNIDDQLTEQELEKDKLKKAIAAARAQLSKIKSEETKLLQELAASTKPIPRKAPKDDPADVDTKAKNQVTFRVLGLKTTRRKVALVVDLAGGRAKHKDAIKKALIRTIDSFQEYHEYYILGYHSSGGSFLTHRWPDLGFMEGGEKSKQEAFDYIDKLMGQFGGRNAMYDALKTGLESEAGAVVLISDGFADPRVNGNRDFDEIVSGIKSLNGEAKEVHSVLVGDFLNYYPPPLVLMQDIAKENNGNFIALLP